MEYAGISWNTQRPSSAANPLVAHAERRLSEGDTAGGAHRSFSSTLVSAGSAPAPCSRPTQPCTKAARAASSAARATSDSSVTAGSSAASGAGSGSAGAAGPAPAADHCSRCAAACGDRRHHSKAGSKRTRSPGRGRQGAPASVGTCSAAAMIVWVCEHAPTEAGAFNNDCAARGHGCPPSGPAALRGA
jgi:hypothetical protein